MMALSIRQPWAHFVAQGIKPVENRDWHPYNPGLKFRGPFLIHASKKLEKSAFLSIGRISLDLPDPLFIPDHYDLGGIVGIGEVTDIVRNYDSPWFFGPLALVIKNARPLPFRPYLGQLGFFKVDETALYTRDYIYPP